jgi:hypothetical protein
MAMSLVLSRNGKKSESLGKRAREVTVESDVR